MVALLPPPLPLVDDAAVASRPLAILSLFSRLLSRIGYRVQRNEAAGGGGEREGQRVEGRKWGCRIDAVREKGVAPGEATQMRTRSDRPPPH